jgi:hypothetical protein
MIPITQQSNITSIENYIHIQLKILENYISHSSLELNSQELYQNIKLQLDNLYNEIQNNHTQLRNVNWGSNVQYPWFDFAQKYKTDNSLIQFLSNILYNITHIYFNISNDCFYKYSYMRIIASKCFDNKKPHNQYIHLSDDLEKGIVTTQEFQAEFKKELLYMSDFILMDCADDFIPTSDTIYDIFEIIEMLPFDNILPYYEMNLINRNDLQRYWNIICAFNKENMI